MSETRVFECPSCGAELSVKGQEIEVRCVYCGKTALVPEALRPPPPPPPAPPPSPPPAPPPQIVMRRPPIVIAPGLPPMAPTRPRRRSGGCATLLVLLVILAIAFWSSSTPQQRNTILKGVAAVVPTAAPTVAPISRPLPGPLPRRVHYANLAIAVTGATISNQVPSAAGQGNRYRADRGYASLDLSITNALTNKSVYLYQGYIRLRLADGALYEEQTGWADGFDPQATKEVKLLYALPITAEWKGAELVVGQAGKEPAILPLEGPMPAAAYPLSLPAGGEATAQKVTYKITAALLDLDSNGERADLGKQFLGLSLQLTNRDVGPAGIDILPGNFRLLVDGVSLAPTESPIEALNPSSTMEAEVVFTLPAKAGRIELQVGDVAQPGTALIPIALNAAKSP